MTIYQAGNKNYRTIIFVHGFPYDHFLWEDLFSTLKNNYFCISYDLRGLGQTPAGDGQYTIESFVDDIEELIEELKLIKPVLCGISMGGYISFRAIERMQDKFSSVIFCDTKPEADDNKTKIRRAEGIKKINTLGVQKFVEDFVPTCFAEESIKKLGEKYSSILERSKTFSPVGVKGCLLAMAGRTDSSHFLEKIKIPSLFVCGEKDNFTPPEQMKKYADKVSDSNFVVVPNVGHMSPVENPEFVAEAIHNFLSSI